MNPTEQWRPVLGFEDRYEVSDLGRIRGLPRNYIKSNGSPGSRKLRYLKQSRFIRGKDYRRVCFCVDGDRVNLQVHIVVLEAFRGPRPLKHETRHLNGIQADNRLENLAWGTKAENLQDIERHGTRKRGSLTKKSKLRERDIPEIRAAFRAGKTTQQIAPCYGVTYQTILAVVAGKTWTHV